MVRLPWSSPLMEEKTRQPLLQDDLEVPKLEIFPFDTHDGLIVKVQPPRDNPDPDLHHVPCDIVLVVDVSGSMSTDAPVPGGKGEQMGLSVLDLTKHAARTILETLGPEDRLGMVTFASQARTLQKLLPMNQANKKKADNNIKGMKPLDSTNLWHGILSAIQLFEENSGAEGRLPAIMVLTDGQPNHMCPAQGYVPKLKSLGRLPAIINTFGFGYDLRSGLLKSIAEVSGGNYAFIPDAGMIGTVFIHAVANLQSTFTSNATLSLTYPPYLELIETTGGSVDKQQPVKLRHPKPLHTRLTIPLGNLQYGHSHDIYLRYTTNQALTGFLAAKSEQECEYPPIINAVLAYSGLEANIYDKVICHRRILDTGGPQLSAAGKAYHISRSAIIELLSRVAPLRATDGEHIPARYYAQPLSAEAERLLSSPPAAEPSVRADPRCASLLEDLAGQISLAFRAEFFGRWGIHYLLSLAGAHAKQTCNCFKDPGPLMYGTDSPLFIRCRDRLDKAFDSLPPPKPSKRTTYRGTVSMSSYNRSSAPCFAGDATVFAISASGNEERATKIGRLRGGMSVLTPHGPRKVVAVLKTRVRKETMCLLPMGLMITPWHPVSVDGRHWEFPARMTHRAVRYTGSIYSVLLERDRDVDARAVMVDGVWGVTLGHGLTEAEGGDDPIDVRVHHFLGDYDAVLKSLSGLRRSSARGLLIGGGVARDGGTGLMNGFRRVVLPDSKRLKARRASRTPFRLDNI